MTYRWLNELSQHFLEQDYLLPGQTVDERINVIVTELDRILDNPSYGAKFKEYMAKGWYSLSTPIWTNFGTDRGLPISCFGSHIEDNTESIMSTLAEVGMMTKHGGGTSAYFGKLRERGAEIRDNGKSSGAVHFMGPFDNLITTVSQGSARRGQFAAYLDIEHPDIKEFLQIRGEGSPLQNISYGVCISNAFMNSVLARDKESCDLWAKVLESRKHTGYPYLFFTDNVNDNAPDVYKDCGLKINHSNLCTEILEADTEEESFVCDLASMNVLYYDEWKDTDAVEVLVYVLDAVLTSFIEKAGKIKFMEKAVRFAENQRAIGIGWCGWHSLLQSKRIPWESMDAKMLNNAVGKNIRQNAYRASQKMFEEYGASELMTPYKRRHALLIAIAPTTSSSFIIGQTSSGIEPIQSNYYIKDLQKGKFSIRNPYLMEVLDSYDKNTEEVWMDILQKGGSVQHFEFLTDNERAVFKTFAEISPKEIVIQAAARQRWVDQGQSLNIMIHPSTSLKEINALYIFGWEQGIKTFYYQKTPSSAAQSFARDILECVSCQ